MLVSLSNIFGMRERNTNFVCLIIWLLKYSSTFIQSLIISLIIAWPLFMFGQHQPSIHQQEYNHYKKLEKVSSGYNVNGEGIISLAKNSKATPSTTVFGYLPYWEYPDALDYLQYDLLSHIAVFDFSITANGDVEWPSQWPWTDLINEAHSNGVKVILTAVNFTGSQIHQILHSTSIQQNLFEQLKSTLLTFDLQGVNIDFENVPVDDRGSVLNTFMYNLSEYLHAAVPGCEVSFAAPPVNWGGWDFYELANSCDYLFIMGYNFYGPWSSTSGACAPLTGGSYNIINTCEDEYQGLSYTQPEKLILGVPYYGNYWETTNGNPYASVIDHISTPTFSAGMTKALSHELLWDQQSQTSYLSYDLNSHWYQLWFDSDSSLSLKYDLADDLNYKGIGMWALGYDGHWAQLWNLLRSRYGNPTDVQELPFSHDEAFIIQLKSGELSLIHNSNQKAMITLELYKMNGQQLWDSETRSFDAYRNSHTYNIPELSSEVHLLHLAIISAGKPYSITKKFFIQ